MLTVNFSVLVSHFRAATGSHILEISSSICHDDLGLLFNLYILSCLTGVKFYYVWLSKYSSKSISP